MTQASLRAAIGIVPQDTVLFNDTIGYNIRYGRRDAARTRCARRRAWRRSAHFIERLPRRLRHPGRRARAETFGRREAARRDRPHHPEGAADPDPRRGDLGARHDDRARDPVGARGVSHNRTALVIAHRLSTVVNADSIIVLDDGAIAERGTHSELLARDALYAAMWARQREADEIAEQLRRTREEARAYLPPELMAEEAAE